MNLSPEEHREILVKQGQFSELIHSLGLEQRELILYLLIEIESAKSEGWVIGVRKPSDGIGMEFDVYAPNCQCGKNHGEVN